MELKLVNQIPKEIWIAGISALLGALASFYVPNLLTADDVALEFAPFYKEKFINIPRVSRGQ